MTEKQTRTLNEGAYKAGDGQYIFELGDLDGMLTGKKYSTAFGPVVEGLRTQVGLMRKEKGTGARPHSHPNEQWNYVVKGRLRVTIDGEEQVVGPGTLLYFPPNVIHCTVAEPDEDVYFFVVKDLTHSIQGNLAGGEPEGHLLKSSG